jgi:hypothetical protein
MIENKIKADTFGNIKDFPSLTYIVQELEKLDNYNRKKVCRYLMLLKEAQLDVFPVISKNPYLLNLVYKDFYIDRLEGLKKACQPSKTLLNSLRDYTKRMFYPINKLQIASVRKQRRGC